MDSAEAAKWGIVDEVRRRRQAAVRALPDGRAQGKQGKGTATEVIGLRPPRSSPPASARPEPPPRRV